jgi:hypothetical protein
MIMRQATLLGGWRGGLPKLTPVGNGHRPSPRFLRDLGPATILSRKQTIGPATDEMEHDAPPATNLKVIMQKVLLRDLVSNGIGHRVLRGSCQRSPILIAPHPVHHQTRALMIIGVCVTQPLRRSSTLSEASRASMLALSFDVESQGVIVSPKRWPRWLPQS